MPWKDFFPGRLADYPGVWRHFTRGQRIKPIKQFLNFTGSGSGYGMRKAWKRMWRIRLHNTAYTNIASWTSVSSWIVGTTFARCWLCPTPNSASTLCNRLQCNSCNVILLLYSVKWKVIFLRSLKFQVHFRHVRKETAELKERSVIGKMSCIDRKTEQYLQKLDGKGEFSASQCWGSGSVGSVNFRTSRIRHHLYRSTTLLQTLCKMIRIKEVFITCLKVFLLASVWGWMHSSRADGQNLPTACNSSLWASRYGTAANLGSASFGSERRSWSSIVVSLTIKSSFPKIFL